MHRSLKVALCAAAIGAAVLPNLPASAATFGTPVVVTSANASEPGVEVAPDGTVYVHAPLGIPLWSPIWRSTNGGASFQQLTSLTRAGLGGGDIDMAIQPDGSLNYTDLWLGSSTVGTSSDKGDNWLANDLQGTLVQDRQWTQTTGRDIAYHVTHQLGTGLVVSKSVDGGLTYPVQQVAATLLDQGNCNCPAGYLVAEAGTQAAGLDDKVGVSYTTSTGVKFARSLNGGLTWTSSVVDPTGGASTLESFPVVANAGGNKLVAAWMDLTSSASRIMTSTSLNWGQTWSAPTVLVNTGTSVFPWIDARGSKVAVTLYHTATGGTPDNAPASAQWYIKYLESSDGGATFGSLVTADATPVKTGPICTDGLFCNADRELGDFQMVAVDAAGTSHISYVRELKTNDTEVRYVKQS